MRLNPFKRREAISPVDADVRYLADVVRASGEAQEALTLGLESIPPERHANLLLRVFEGLPPVLRIAILGNGNTNDGGAALADALQQVEADEKRPMMVSALIARSQKTRRVDLADVPPGSLLRIGLYYREPDLPCPEQIHTARHATSLALESMGDGVFEAQTGITLSQRGGSAGAYIYEHHATRLGSFAADDTFTTVACYGKPLAAFAHDFHYNVIAKDSERSRLKPPYVGKLLLDNRVAFVASR